MSTTSGGPATRQALGRCETWNAPPAAATCTVPGWKLHESTVMRRLTGSKALGCEGTIDEAKEEPAASAHDAARARQDLRKDMGDLLWVSGLPLFSHAP